MSGWKGQDIYTGEWVSPYRGPSRPMWTPEDESSFMNWWKKVAEQTGWQGGPDDPGHAYDYRGAYQRGYQPGVGAHWPSDLKYPEHPRRFINLYDTPTGNQAPWIVNSISEP